MRNKGSRLLEATRRFVRSHLAEKLPVARLASNAGYSVSRFRDLLSAAAGMPPHRLVLEERIRRAGELLASGEESVLDVASAVGFADGNYFSVAFKRLTGVPPSRYRRQAGPGTASYRWKPVSGSWSSRQGELSCRADPEAVTLRTGDLPAEFEVRFECAAEPIHPDWQPQAGMVIASRDSQAIAYAITLLPGRRPVCALRRRNRLVASAPLPGRALRWHDVRVRVSRRGFRIAVSGATALSYDDPFPLPYEERTAFGFHAYRSLARFRKLRLVGERRPSPVTDVVLADAFYHRGEVEHALELYRSVAGRRDDENAAEARFKEAVCVAEIGMRDEGRSRLRRLGRRPATDWAFRARVHELQLTFDREEPGGLSARVVELVRDSSDHTWLPYRLQEIADRGYAEGEPERALALFDELARLLPVFHPVRLHCSVWCVDCLVAVGRLKEAVERCRALRADRAVPPERRVWSRAVAAHALLLAGKARVGREELPPASATRRFPDLDAERESLLAIAERSRGAYARAAGLFDTLARRRGMGTGAGRTALSRQATLCFCLGRRDEGERVLRTLRGGREDELSHVAVAWCRIIERKYYDANRAVLDAHPPRSSKAEAALELLSALLSGLAEAGTSAERLRENLQVVEHRYRRSAWHRASALARCVLTGRTGAPLEDALRLFPVHQPLYRDSAFLYLASLAMERLGLKREARAAMLRCSRGDRTRPWPVVLARRRVRRATLRRP